MRDVIVPVQVREAYTRVLRAWAMDLLELRRRGLDRPGFRRGAWEHAGLIGPEAHPFDPRARAAA